MQDNNNEHKSPHALGLTIYDLPDPVQVVQQDASRTNAGRIRMIFVMLVCAAPVIASYLTYYVIRPQTLRNFGTLIQPVKPLPDISAQTLDGKEVSLSSLKDQWLLVSVGSGSCDSACQTHLLLQRQIRASLGREKDRTDWVWLITDNEPVSKELLAGMPDAVVLRVAPNSLSQWLSAEPGRELAEHLYLIDPHGNWMMRFPPALSMEQAAPLKRDWERLLRASVSWDKPGR
jgi:hypothetical protein